MRIIAMRPSHRFVLRALISVQKPQRIIEFGAGINSTQMLKDSTPSFTSYETHPEWIAKIQAEVPGVDIRPLPLNVDSYRVYPYKVPADTRQKIYDDLTRLVEDVDLVFVDGYASMRIYALLAFIGHFGVCVCHDSEKDAYWYYKAEKRMIGYTKVTVVPPKRAPYTDVIFAPQCQHLIPDFVAALQRECLVDYGAYASVTIKNITTFNVSKKR